MRPPSAASFVWAAQKRFPFDSNNAFRITDALGYAVSPPRHGRPAVKLAQTAYTCLRCRPSTSRSALGEKGVDGIGSRVFPTSARLSEAANRKHPICGRQARP